MGEALTSTWRIKTRIHPYMRQWWLLKYTAKVTALLRRCRFRTYCCLMLHHRPFWFNMYTTVMLSILPVHAVLVRTQFSSFDKRSTAFAGLNLPEPSQSERSANWPNDNCFQVGSKIDDYCAGECKEEFIDSAHEQELIKNLTNEQVQRVMLLTSFRSTHMLPGPGTGCSDFSTRFYCKMKRNYAVTYLL